MSEPSRLKEMRDVLSRHKITRGVTPAKLRMILEDLGPTYIKIGQIMSLHSDILPKAYCDELMHLNSEVTPMPFDAVLRVMRASYGEDPKGIFSCIDETPLGSASIAQVHRARLIDGTDVIVKVEREGIYDIMRRDIALLHRAVRLLPPVPSLKNLVDLDMVLDEMWNVAQEEMDFLKEASNMEEFARANKDVAYIRVPRLYREYTTPHVLVMEYIDGIPVNDRERLLSHGYDLNEIGVKFADNFIKQVMRDGYFHADPHPGNVCVLDGKLVWLDMGMMGRLSDHDRSIMVKGVRGIAMHDVRMVEDAVLALGDFWGEPDRDRLYQDLKQFIDTYGETSMGSLNLAEALEALTDILKNNKIGIPHGMTMLVRGLTHAEGVLADIAPDISMISIASRRVGEDFLRDLDIKEETLKLFRQGYRAVYRSSELPVLLTDAMHEYLKGRTRISFDLHSTDSLSRVIYQSVRNLVIGLTITALLISSSILCTTDMQPQVFDIPLVGAFGYLIAIAAIVFFFVRFLWRRLHK